jgi:hypothetical protein
MHVFFPPGGLTAERVVEESEIYTTPVAGFSAARWSDANVRWDKPKRKS